MRYHCFPARTMTPGCFPQAHCNATTPTGLVALQCACGKQPGIMIRAGKQWYLMRVESVKNATTVYSDKIAFCRGCFRPLQQDEPSAVPYEFGHDSAFDKQVRLLR